MAKPPWLPCEKVFHIRFLQKKKLAVSRIEAQPVGIVGAGFWSPKAVSHG